MGASVKGKVLARQRRHRRVRRKIKGTHERPRICVFRSLNHIYGQIIDDVSGKTVLSVSSLGKELKGNVDGAKKMGALLAAAALKANIKEVLFDRNGYLYHGRVKAFAESAREGGLVF